MKCNNGRCPRIALTNRRNCERCARQKLEATRRSVAKKLAAGICIDCPIPVEVGKRRCAKHLERASEYALKSHGYIRRREYRPQIDQAVDDEDVAYVPRVTPLDRKLSALGRCARCHLLNPCVCLPTIYDVASMRFGESAG